MFSYEHFKFHLTILNNVLPPVSGFMVIPGSQARSTLHTPIKTLSGSGHLHSWVLHSHGYGITNSENTPVVAGFKCSVKNIWEY